ncbi:IS91 family transposase [Neorhodopirellula pilleata]|uniref:Putative transposase n=1 Tax=Neorhodopirellula pilleata TaxID=2714738 RepID=A0A5C6A0Y2_9BACT|nr:transposase [Neorhodopirellula pilleata]TWT93492.1 putative transposase [Neorhodopirellula pilleata]
MIVLPSPPSAAIACPVAAGIEKLDETVASAPGLSVAGLLKRYAPRYLQKHGVQAVPQVQSTLAKLSLCRTRALGGHVYRCRGCQSETPLYNSCGDRHCPQCSGAKRADWLDSTSELLVPGVTYFQVVFTLPEELAALSLGNRREIYNLLFHSAWQALRDQIALEQGFEAAAAMVLHTWNQKLEAHPHVHALVPGGGPSLDRSRPGWISSRKRSGKPSSTPYLVDAKELRKRYREFVLKGLVQLREREKLKLEGDWSRLKDQANWDEWLGRFENKTWVSFIQAPPNEDCRPEHVAKYLARYMTGGPISDRRLISHEDGKVQFWARVGDQTGGGDGRSAPYTLSGIEFARRWSMHILPRGFTKSRRYGGFSNRHRDRYLKECAAWMNSQDEPPQAADAKPEHDEPSDEDTVPTCPHCDEEMELIRWSSKPSWSDVMSSQYRPWWYRDD